MAGVLLIALLALLGFSGCATTPASGSNTAPTSLQTFDTVYSTSLQALTLILNETNIALTDKAITASQAQTIVGYTDSIKTVLDAASTAESAANTSLATANVAQATAQIASISICLTQKPLTAASFSTCTRTLSNLTPVTS